MRRFSYIRELSLALVVLVLGSVGAAQVPASKPPGTVPAPVSSPASDAAAAQVAADQLSDKVSDKLSPEKPPTVPVIGGGDLLKISVLGAPESDQEVRVGSDGNISLNFIGAVHVAGLTTEEAQSQIGKKLAAGGYFTNPQVSVFAKEYATQGVSIMGEVQKPGVYPLLGSRTLFDVLAMAGGTTPKAGKTVGITHRGNPLEPMSVSLSNDASTSAHSNVDIYPGDTVVVSRAGMVYVVGDVRRPSGVLMENGSAMTVLQAIAMAEGVNPTAALNGGKIIRKTSSGPKEIPLMLKKILSAKAPDVELRADDIVFVPSSAAKSAGKRSLEAIIQIASGLAYRPY
jgi:polysaccharide biosynthesis/export protein